MKIARLPLSAAAVALLLAPAASTGTARAEATLTESISMRVLTHIVTQYMLLFARTMVDLTYEHLAVDAQTGDIVITGMKLYPALDWDADGTCEVSIDRISASQDITFEGLDSRREMTGVDVAASCFQPEQAGMMAAFGYDGLHVDNLSIDMSYEFSSSAADVTVHAAVKDAAVVTVTADFDYVWITGLLPSAANDYSGEPYPVGLLSEAEIAIENKGIFERLEPMLAGQLGDLNAAPGMIQAGLMQALTEGGQPPGPEAVAFVENVASEVGRFIQEKNRIVLSVAPPDGVWLDESIFTSPVHAIATLKPMVSAAPLISRSLISNAELSAAINGQAATLDDAARLRVGSALLTGLGAPRSITYGRALLQPMAEQWNAGASLLLAEALSDSGEDEQAYRMALRAAAGGETKGVILADQLEEKLGADFVLGAQIEAAQSWPGSAGRQAEDQTLIRAADVGAMRERAHSAALGRGAPRSYGDAFYWASLAAAAGDRSSAGLRERLDRRFAGAEGPARDAWNGVSQQAAANAIQTWTNGGLGAAVAALYGVAQ